MSEFKAGDVVVRKANFVDEDSIFRCERGIPVIVASSPWDGGITFSKEDGGEGWLSANFELYNGQTTEKEMTVEAAIRALTDAGYEVTIKKL